MHSPQTTPAETTATCLHIDNLGRCTHTTPVDIVFCQEHYNHWETQAKDNFKTIIRKFLAYNK